MTIASALCASLSIASPPPTLSIFAVSVYVQQTINLSSMRDASKTSCIKGPVRYIIKEGVDSGCGQSGFAERARKDGTVLFCAAASESRGSKGKQREEGWSWKGIGRLVRSSFSSFIFRR